MKRTQFFIPQPMLDALKAISKKQDVSVAELIRRAIEDFIRKHK